MRSPAFVLCAALAGLSPLLPCAQAGAFGWPSEVAQVGRGLSSEQSSERERAAARLSTLSPSAAAPLIELALEDEDDAVRLAAARAAVVHAQPGLGEQVLGWLKEPTPAARGAALRVLSIELEGRHVPSVARATLDPDDAVRSAAVRCLGRARLADAPEALSALTTALDDASPMVRADAAVALGRLGDAGSTGPLVAHMTDAEESVRRAAAVALGAVGDRRATPALSFALEDRSVRVAAAAARSLGELGDPSAVSALERTLLSPGWGPRHIASAQALARLDQRRGWDAIVRRLAEQDAVPSLRVLFSTLTASARATVSDCLLHSGGLSLLECARLGVEFDVPLDALLDRVRRGGLPTAKLFRAVGRTSDVELLVLAIERLERGSAAERHAALELLDRSAPLPRETTGLLGRALEVPGLDAKDVARLLLLLRPTDIRRETLEQLTHASDPVVAATARALAWTVRAQTAPVLAPFDSTALEAGAFGRLLARGMEQKDAERLLSALLARGAPLPAPVLAALAGIPRDLSPASVDDLARLAGLEQGGARDFLLSLLASQKAGDPALGQLFGQGSVQDRRTLSASLLHLAARGSLAKMALSDPDPWVRAHAAQGSLAGEAPLLLELARSDAPAFVRAAALLGLARTTAKHAAESLAACDLLDAPELGVRVGALYLVDRAGSECPKRPLGDMVLLEREPLLRELAARALARRDPGHRALRSCRAYEADAEVVLGCGGRTTGPSGLTAPGGGKLAFVEVVPPWLDEPAPSCPYALLDGAGNLFIGVTDRRGQALVPGPASARLLDPRVAL